MTNKQIIDGKECRYWFRLNPDDYRKCSLRGKNDNCDEITDCFIKELLGKLALKEQECEQLKRYEQAIEEIENIIGRYKLNENVIKLNRINPIDVQEILNIVKKVKCLNINK